MTQGKGKGVRYWLIYSMIVGAVAFLVCEVYLRLTGLAPVLNSQYSHFTSDPFLPYKPRPLSRHTGGVNEDHIEFVYEHNSMGLRSEEHTFHKPKDVFRILGVGDSFTYGIGAEFEDTYLSQLERKLNNRGYKISTVEIIKAGIPGFFTEPERLMVEHYGLEYQPDLILIGFLANDILDAYLGMDYFSLDKKGFLKTEEARKLGAWGHFLYTYSHVARVFLDQYVRLAREQRHYYGINEVYNHNIVFDQAWNKVESELLKIKGAARTAGAKAGVVYIPQGYEWTRLVNYPRDRLRAFCLKHDILFVDTVPAMEQAAVHSMGQLYWPRDGHCTRHGYGVIARAIEDALLSADYIP